MGQATALLSVVLLAVLAVGAGPTTAPVKTDLCRGAVDPYVPGTERVRFFQAAGKDSELDAKEFEADRTRPDPFVRTFDSWKAIAAFDKDGNGTIDWFEAEAYRLSVRKRILSAYDTNKDGRLTGKERDAANRALAAGRIPPAPAKPKVPVIVGPASPPAATRPARPVVGRPAAPDEALEKYDTDGDGALSEQEARAARRAMRDQLRTRMLAKYDANGDGKLDAEERRAMRRDNPNPFAATGRQWVLRHFDEDGDGKLGEQEALALQALRKDMRQLRRRLEGRLFDADGDGKVTPTERREKMRQYRVVGLVLLGRVMKEMDADGNGQVSDAERRGYLRKAGRRFGKRLGEWTERFDGDGDGRLNSKERQGMVRGLEEELLARQEKFDANRDGQLDASEMSRLMAALGEEFGLFRRSAPAVPARGKPVGPALPR